MRKTIEWKRLSIDLNSDWDNVFRPKNYNWVEFNWLKLYSENDRMHGCSEIELYILGFGVRFYWVSNKKQHNKAFKKYDKIMKNTKTFTLDEAREMLK